MVGQTTDPALIGLQLSVLAPQKYQTDVDDTNLSGQLSAAYTLSKRVNAYVTYATGFKSVGLNLNGVPTDAANQPVIAAAAVKPEDVRNIEFGLKTQPARNVIANITAYDTEIKNFQTQVTNASVGVLRGYLANAQKVRVRGAELDANTRINSNLSFYGAVAYTDGRYVSFVDAPPPLEETGGPSFKDISGSVLPGISKWALSAGGEYMRPLTAFRRHGQIFGALDTSYRSRFSSSASFSKHLVVDGYVLVNARVGFRAGDGWAVFLWARNLFDKNYFELLTAAPGNTGLFVGQPGDGRTIGLTLRFAVKSR
jgi:iron complex outermembrane recepter protein